MKTAIKKPLSPVNLREREGKGAIFNGYSRYYLAGTKSSRGSVLRIFTTKFPSPLKDALPPPLRADRLPPSGAGGSAVPLDVVKEAVRVIVPLTIPSYILTVIPRETFAFTLSLLS